MFQTNCSELVAKVTEDEIESIIHSLQQGAVITENQEPNVSDHLIRHCIRTLEEILRQNGFTGTLISFSREQSEQGYIYGFYDMTKITHEEAEAQMDRMYQ
ncbi:MAG TPA: hypothetical protein VF791_02480 [Pyrinomonadaceae bacterium]